mmetsp:Transcript_21208/g.32170  ORF Transcript_21208/g.32170 Transcript_21208/m.32170 type:complete len:979 (+) Transcript_21208:81-3017(+)
MLRHSLHVSRRTRTLQINSRLFHLTESFLQQERFQTSEAKVEQQKKHGENRRKGPLRQSSDQVDPFADRWRAAVKGRPNPISRETRNSVFSQQHNTTDGNLNKPAPKSWRTRLQEKAREQKANQSQDVLASFLNQRNQQNEQHRSPPSGRKESPPPNKRNESPITDMKDVSALRAAFLKNIKTQPNVPRRQPEEEKPEWRQTGGAREYRKRMKQEQLAERRHKAKKRNNYQNRYVSAIDNAVFFGSKKEMDAATSKQEQEKLKQQQYQKNDKEICLPSSSVSVSTLSSMFRVKIDELLKMLRKYEYREKSSAENKDVQNFLSLDENTMVDLDTMELLALDLGLDVVRSSDEVVHRSASEETRHLLLQHRRGVTDENADAGQDLEKLQPRPPVVCIMGHVDHGKTTLMDTLRRKSQNDKFSSTKKKSKKKKKSGNHAGGGDIAGTEAGGITQAISAFQVSLEQDDTQAVTFLDTPGHAAFRKMRESGSNAADVICLVIAADDGVSAQTLEILEFYKSIVSDAGTAISLLVAMTKVDKPGVNVDESRTRIEAQLMEHGIMPESYGISPSDGMCGPPVQVVPVSGLTGEGVEELIESLTLQTEIMELRAIADDLAEGIVMDARVEKGIGAVVDCIIRWGSLKRGDVVVSGIHYGKVKALKSVNNAVLKEGVPSQPVRIVGFKSLPKAGDPMICVETEEEAEEMVERRLAISGGEESIRSHIEDQTEIEVTGVAAQQSSMLERIHAKYDIAMNTHSNSDIIHIPVIIKADADATLSALREAVLAIGKGESVLEDKTMIIDVISQGIGAIDANDIQIAKESNAPIFCFNIKAGTALSEDSKDVIIESHNVIYSLLDKAKDVFSEKFLPKSRVEKLQGRATIQAIFDMSGSNKIAGLKVIKGTLFLNKSADDRSKCFYRVVRGGKVVSPDGDVVLASSLKRMKNDVQSVQEGEECGLGLDGYTSYEEGDTVECYSVDEQRVELK